MIPVGLSQKPKAGFGASLGSFRKAFKETPGISSDKLKKILNEGNQTNRNFSSKSSLGDIEEGLKSLFEKLKSVFLEPIEAWEVKSNGKLVKLEAHRININKK